MHCDIKYSDELQRYVIQDHASQCGTYVNNKRLSEVRERSPTANGVLEIRVYVKLVCCPSRRLLLMVKYCWSGREQENKLRWWCVWIVTFLPWMWWESAVLLLCYLMFNDTVP